MEKIFMLILFTASILTCKQSSNSQTTDSGVFEKLTKEEFSKKLEEKSDRILIDVRTPEEYQQGTIREAININFYDENFENELAKLDKMKPIFIFCKSGGRSEKTLKKMKAMDFKEVYDLKGGYSGWSN